MWFMRALSLVRWLYYDGAASCPRVLSGQVCVGHDVSCDFIAVSGICWQYWCTLPEIRHRFADRRFALDYGEGAGGLRKKPRRGQARGGNYLAEENDCEGFVWRLREIFRERYLLVFTSIVESYFLFGGYTA